MILQKIIDAVPSLQKVSAAELSLKNLYKVHKMVSELDTEVEFFNNEKEKIISKYRDENVKTEVKISKENIDAVNREIRDLLNVEVEPDFVKIQLPDTEDIKLSVNDLKALDGFVEIIFEKKE
jgi:hypothetical protein